MKTTASSAVQIQTSGERQTICFTFTKQLDRLRALSHPAILGMQEETYECSRGMRPNKRWWQESGLTVSVSLPRTLIQLKPECGYSYVQLIIAGQPVVLNVVGGTAAASLAEKGITWVDWIHATPHTLLDMPIDAFEHILAVISVKE